MLVYLEGRAGSAKARQVLVGGRERLVRAHIEKDCSLRLLREFMAPELGEHPRAADVTVWLQ